MGTTDLPPNPYSQPNPTPESPPGVPAATPIPASTITGSDSPSSPEGRAKIERAKKFMYNSAIGLCVLIPVVIAAPPRKYDFWTYGLGVAWANSLGYIVQEKTGQGLIWHIGSRLPSEANRIRRREAREEENMQRRAKGLPEIKRGMFERVWMGKEEGDWIERRKNEESEALKEGGKGVQGLIVDQVKEVLGFRKFKDDEEEEEKYGKKGTKDK